MSIVKVGVVPGEALSPGDWLAVDEGGLVRKAKPGEYWVGVVPTLRVLASFGESKPPAGMTFLVPRDNMVQPLKGEG